MSAPDNPQPRTAQPSLVQSSPLQFNYNKIGQVINNLNQNHPKQNHPRENVVEVEPLKFDPSTKKEVNARNAEMRKISDEVTLALGETPDFFYCMSTGYVLIINNEKFPDPEAERKGSQEDSIAVSKLFKDILGWHVETRKDISAQQMKEEIQKISKCQDFPYSALFVFVFSHGDEEGVRGSDSQQAVSIVDDLLENFKGSESFNKVPKFFVVQACRGQNLDIASDGPREEVAEVLTTLPTLTDFMIAHASPPSYKAMRNEEHGSWFIQEFVDLTKKYYACEDIVSIFNRVNFKVADKSGCTYVKEDEFESEKIVKAQPCFEVALRRRCFFAKYFEQVNTVYEAYKRSNISHNPPSQTTARKM